MQLTQSTPVNFFDQWTPLKTVGSGSTCDVLLVQENESSAKKVIKVFIPTVKPAVPEAEAKLMTSLSHPRILSASGFFPKVTIPQDDNSSSQSQDHKQYSALVLDYIPNGDLLGLTQSFGRLPEQIARTYLLQLIDALEYLHEKSICHLDIKPDNILVDENYNLKLADFGAAAQIPKNALVKGAVGTAVYHTPEIHMKKTYSTYQADVFALGMTLFTMVTGNMPFLSAKASDPVYKHIIDGEYEQFWEIHESLKAPNCEEFSAEFKSLIQAMLAFDVSKRLSLEQVRRHDWVAQDPVLSEEKLFQLMDCVFNASHCKEEEIELREEAYSEAELIATVC